jgi:hypothetical protein
MSRPKAPESSEEKCSTCDGVLGKGQCRACHYRRDNPPELPSRQHKQRFNYQVVLFFKRLRCLLIFTFLK